MRRLSERNHVIWINWHASRCPRIGWQDIKLAVSKLRQVKQGARQINEKMTVMTPMQIPLPGSSLMRKVNTKLVRRAIEKELRRLPDWPIQVWSFAPDVSDLFNQFNEELDLYYCVDAFGEFPGFNRELIERRERELMDRCDLVLTTSSPLYEAKKLLHPNVHLFQHGVDHAHLSRAISEAPAIPEDLKNLPRPIFGFVGVIGEWVDHDLIADLAERNRHASIVMIGPETTSRGKCAHQPNIHFLGAKDYTQLPTYLKQFDVGLIPFRNVALTRNANPIKLYEYLAAGVPTVSTSLPAVEPREGSVWIADDASMITACCHEAMNYNDPTHRARRSRDIFSESWTQRVEQMSALIEQTLNPQNPLKTQPLSQNRTLVPQSA
jgi:hypothetical protein